MDILLVNVQNLLGARRYSVRFPCRNCELQRVAEMMIATLDRLMLLQQKLHDAEKQTEREPIHIAFDLNELHILQRMLDDSLGELDPYASASHRSEAY